MELLLEDARDPAEKVRPLARLRPRFEARQIQLDERLPPSGVRMELLELEKRLVVRGVDLADLLPRRRRGIGLARLVPDVDGSVRIALAIACIGIAGYLIFLLTVDVPMYVGRWRDKAANGSRRLRPLEGLRDASTRWVVTRDFAAWKDEIMWMSLYFSAAVWSSLALCVFYALQNRWAF